MIPIACLILASIGWAVVSYTLAQAAIAVVERLIGE